MKTQRKYAAGTTLLVAAGIGLALAGQFFYARPAYAAPDQKAPQEALKPGYFMSVK